VFAKKTTVSIMLPLVGYPLLPNFNVVCGVGNVPVVAKKTTVFVNDIVAADVNIEIGGLGDGWMAMGSFTDGRFFRKHRNGVWKGKNTSKKHPRQTGQVCLPKSHHEKREPKIRVLFVAPKRCRLIGWLMTTKATRLCLYEITRTHHRDGAFFRAPAFRLLG
jgi:hypothetical protein